MIFVSDRRAIPGTNRALPAAVLLDRDGTLIVDVPCNRDRSRVVPMPGAFEALERFRAAGIPLALVSNQAAVGRGDLTLEDVVSINARVEELLGELGPRMICTHREEQRCGCRKPDPGLILRAAGALGVDPERCVMIGDTGADVEAALAAGARAILVPNEVTRPAEILRAPEVAGSLLEAARSILGDVPERVA
ncbi:MAG: D-glycero-alpha-D-manno-heptose-1,7-bisphosphate 7-phosphatase [Actinomycetota bacterium]